MWQHCHVKPLIGRKSESKFFVRTTEILNKITNNLIGIAKFLNFFQENFEKFERNCKSIFRTVCKTPKKETKILTIIFINRKS